jgi:energy-coupling factor transport system permease protein
MNKLIFGRYIPGDSVIHRLDPRAKLVASFYFIGIIFLANNWQSYLFFGIFTMFAVFLSKISLIFFL